MPDVMILNPWDSQGNRISDSDGVFQCIRCGKYSGYPQGYILHRAYTIQMDGKNKSDVTIDQTPTLTVPDKQSKVMAVVTENSVEGGVAMYENHAHDSRYTGPLTVSQTVSQLFGTGGNNTPIIVEVK